MMRFLSRRFTQRGAMFGIDARVAMAVLGALSVVTGYIGYSQITAARHGALLSEVQQIDKAVRELQSSVGTFYQFAISTPDGVRDFDALTDSTMLLTGFQGRWSGPYLTQSRRDHPIYGVYTLTYGQADRTACTVNSTCFVWIDLTQVPADVWTTINRQMDEDNGETPETTPISEGLVRADAANDPRTLYYRSAERPRGR
jgi:hypothetical protein